MKTRDVVRALAALAQETRLTIYRRLVEAGRAGLAAGEIGAAIGVAPTNLSFHLKALSHAGLVEARQDGRYIYYSAQYEHMSALVSFLTENCCAADRGCGAPARSHSRQGVSS
jgi:DNA-binding transcriptional ArsR family regulator